MDIPVGLIEPSGKRVRAILGGEVVADTASPLLVWEHSAFPGYWLAEGDVRTDQLPVRSWRRGAGDLTGYVRIRWDVMDHWLEEDEEVFVHPRSPYARVDILASSRRVEVALGGVTVADSVRPRLLFETGLPVRYYLPLTDVRIDLLRPSKTTSMCPYKGTADYWSVEAGGKAYPDVVWTYRAPLPESQKIAGLVCFNNERVELTVDGVLHDRPVTKFS